jgi:hypothetical protein
VDSCRSIYNQDGDPELQQHIDAAGTDESNFYLPFAITTTTLGHVWVGTLNITLQVLDHNEPPWVKPSGFDHYFMFEDDAASGDNLLDLEDYFMDDHDSAAELKYEIAISSAPDSLMAEMDADGHNVDFTPAPDFYGTVQFRVNVTDTGRDEVMDTFDDLTIISNFFNVTVAPVNDAPSLIPPSEALSMNDSEMLKFNVTVTDVDDDTFSWESNLTDKISVTPDMDNSSKAEVVVMNTAEDVGEQIHFQVIVSDSGGGEGASSKLSNEHNFTVDVLNLNDPPKLEEFTLLRDSYTEPAAPGTTIKLKNGYGAWEDEHYNISVTASDPDIDIDPDEALTFAVEALTSLNGTLGIDPVSGLLSFLPVNEDVGTVALKVTVTDEIGESAEQELEIQVKNRNDAPRNIKILKPTVFKFNENETIDFLGECDDDDLYIPDTEESLTFIWTTNRSAQPIGMGEELLGKSLEPGVHEITLKVVDALGDSISTSIELTVMPLPDDKPDDDPKPDPDDKDKNKTDKDDNKTGLDGLDEQVKGTSLFAVGLSMLVIAIIICVVVVALFTRKRKKEKEEEEAATLTAQPGVAQPPMMPGYPQMPGMQQGQVQPGMEYMAYPGMEQQFQQTGQQQALGYPPLQDPQVQFGLPAAQPVEQQPGYQTTEPAAYGVEPEAESREPEESEDLSSSGEQATGSGEEAEAKITEDSKDAEISEDSTGTG